MSNKNKKYVIKINEMHKWFGSFHDGTKEGHELMKQRRKKAHGLI